MENVEIRKIKPLEHKQFKAKVDIALKTTEFGFIVIKGFRVGPSKFGTTWVEPPSYKVFGNYFKCFFLENRDLWHQLQTFIIKACIDKGIDLPETPSEDVQPSEVDL